ncbi:MAG: CAP domain-containing protein [Candidatus Andersenbacteria bacterium]
MGIAARCLHGAGLCVIPKPANGYRPLALRHGPLAFVSTLLVVAKVLAVGIVALTPASADLSTITAARIVQLTNNERKKADLSELTVNSQLTNAAQQKGQHMLQEDYFAHISPTGVTPWFWMSKVGYTYQIAGENLAIDFIEAEDVVAAWLASPTHKENMLHTQYTETGIGVVTGEFQGGTSTIVVHMFGLPPGQQAPSPVPAARTQTTKAATPSPSPSPLPPPTSAPTPPPDTTPPRIPRIAVVGSTIISTTGELTITGEPGSTVHILINSQAYGRVVLGAQGEATWDLATDDFPDGTLTVRAYSTDYGGNQSQESEPLALLKDTVGPMVARENVSFIVFPATDDPHALLTLRGDSYEWVRVSYGSDTTTHEASDPIVVPITSQAIAIALVDDIGNTSVLGELSLQPQFASMPDHAYLQPPARLSELTRHLTAAIFTAILILLILAILIRIRIQHPALIAHASLVLLLATVLFFW